MFHHTTIPAAEFEARSKSSPRQAENAGPNESMATNPTDQIYEIERSLNLLLAPNAVAELRILGVGEYDATFFGFFDSDHRREMAQAALEFSGKAEGIYVTLNRIHPGLLARMPNHVARASKRKDLTTSDCDVIRRIWLPADIDPRRPKGISATDEERKWAWDAALNLRDGMASEGWQQSILADSGNGYHHLYGIDYPNDRHALDTVKAVLAALACKYNSDKVEIDVRNSNAARIWKLYGTMACKGYPLPDRPHRYSKILSIPEGLNW